MNNKIDIKSLTYDKLLENILKINLPKYKASQIFTWVSKGVFDFSSMTNISKKDQAILKENFYITKIKIKAKQISKDGTVKYLFELEDNSFIESVVMKYSYGFSICVSTQVGCKMNCDFCATGKAGFKRNLTPGEIISQIHMAQNDLNIKISNIVLMGMGEPLDNYNNVLKFIKVITSSEGMNFSPRRITISTCGLADKIYKLADENLGIRLSISLHSPFDEERSAIMPINKKYNIKDLLKACKYYIIKTNKRITFEYSLIKDKNENKAHAMALAKLIKPLICHVNLISINKVENSKYNKVSEDDINKFKQILEKQNIPTTIRRTLGNDIDASCGQLSGKLKESSVKRSGWKLKISALSDIGKTRQTNQDFYNIEEIEKDLTWAAVCDGMGGVSGGNIASASAIKVMTESITNSINTSQEGEELKNALVKSVKAANEFIFSSSNNNPSLSGMGTTCVCAIISKNKAYLANVGDSRAYFISNDNIFQITKDHSIVQEMLDSGEITKDEAINHPRKNIITRALGVSEEVKIDCYELDINENDIIFLCTDGFSNYASNEDILKLVKENKFEALAQSAINFANNAGGHDNITVVALRRDIPNG